MQFTNEVMQAKSSGWVYGDLNYKNVIVDVVRFKVIDFRPFPKIIRNADIEHRITPPYFHPLDKISIKFIAYTIRLSLMGLYLRLKLGFRKQQEISSSHASTVYDIPLTKGKLFIEILQNLDKMHA